LQFSTVISQFVYCLRLRLTHYAFVCAMCFSDQLTLSEWIYTYVYARMRACLLCDNGDDCMCREKLWCVRVPFN